MDSLSALEVGRDEISYSLCQIWPEAPFVPPPPTNPFLDQREITYKRRPRRERWWDFFVPEGVAAGGRSYTLPESR